LAGSGARSVISARWTECYPAKDRGRLQMDTGSRPSGGASGPLSRARSFSIRRAERSQRWPSDSPIPYTFALPLLWAGARLVDQRSPFRRNASASAQRCDHNLVQAQATFSSLCRSSHVLIALVSLVRSLCLRSEGDFCFHKRDRWMQR
jgi:hypothetical protein